MIDIRDASLCYRPSEDFSELCGDRKIVDMTAQGITEYVETSNEDTCIIGTSKYYESKGEREGGRKYLVIFYYCLKRRSICPWSWHSAAIPLSHNHFYIRIYQNSGGADTITGSDGGNVSTLLFSSLSSFFLSIRNVSLNRKCHRLVYQRITIPVSISWAVQDLIYGLAGKDVIYGRSGDDIIYGTCMHLYDQGYLCKTASALHSSLILVLSPVVMWSPRTFFFPSSSSSSIFNSPARASKAPRSKKK